MWLFWLWLMVLGTLLITGGCNKTDDSTPPNGTATMSVRMTNTGGSYDKVMVNIQQVRVNLDGQGWVTLSNVRAGMYNLLDFTNGHDTLLATGSIPAGTVLQIRLILGPGNYMVMNGTTYDLGTPSAEESGLKIGISQTVKGGQAYTLWLDFDVSKSIVSQGNGNYSLKPVIRGFLVNNTGSISGDIDPDSASDYVFVMQLNSSGDTTASYPRFDGYFKVSGLAPGSYAVTFLKANSVVKVINPVTVSANYDNNIGTVNIP
jgi:hypothetical protein